MVFRRKKEKVIKREVILEPVRQSLLDVLEKNLGLAKRVIFVHRLLYIGQHSYPEDEISEVIKTNIIKTNQGYCTEPLSGVLLYYQKFFCHIVDGAEETLQKHLALLLKEHGKFIYNCKLLIAVHHINGRFTDNWYAYKGEPPERVEEIDPQSDTENSMRYVKNCCEKLYGFANSFVQDQKRVERKSFKDESGLDYDDLALLDTAETESIPEGKFHVKSGVIANRDTYEEYLPELKLLDFLVNCKHIKDLLDYHRTFRQIVVTGNFLLKIWPLPYNYTPYNVFEEKIDPIEDLPSRRDSADVEDILFAEFTEEQTKES